MVETNSGEAIDASWEREGKYTLTIVFYLLVFSLCLPLSIACTLEFHNVHYLLVIYE